MPTPTYTTTDVQLSAFLMAKGFRLLSMTPEPGSSRRVLHFPPDAAEAASSFFEGGLIEARRFAGALCDLRVLLRRR